MAEPRLMRTAPAAASSATEGAPGQTITATGSAPAASSAIAAEVTGSLGGKVGVAPRVFLKKLGRPPTHLAADRPRRYRQIAYSQALAAVMSLYGIWGWPVLAACRANRRRGAGGYPCRGSERCQAGRKKHPGGADRRPGCWRTWAVPGRPRRTRAC